MPAKKTAKKVTAKKVTAKKVASTKVAAKKATRRAHVRPPELADVDGVIAALKSLATRHTRDGMVRFAIPNDHALGVAMGDIRRLARRVGHDHALAEALWQSGVYEARLLASFVDDPDAVTVAQMDRWCRDFDNWAVCDTVCFALFDRTSHAFGRVDAWADHSQEFIKRGAFALLASLAGHDKTSADAPFLARLPLIERAAADPRNFVKKGVSWALRSLGQRSPALHKAALALAGRLAKSADAAPRWVGKDAVRELTGTIAQARVARRTAARS